jgi:hypothetical protein
VIFYTHKLAKKASFTTKARRRGNVAPLPSKTPFKNIKN